MATPRDQIAAKAITAIVDRYRNILLRAASHGGHVQLVTLEKERPDLMFRGDGKGRAVIAICTDDGDRQVVFSHWPDSDCLHPENWPERLPIPNYVHDPIP